MASGHVGYHPGYKSVQHHEWRTAENSAVFLLAPLAELFASRPQLQLLDVGAGPGTISASLAKRIPTGHVTATDLSSEVLEKARSHAADTGVTNISFAPANVYELPYADASFDVVHTSMVITHLDAPIDALREMLRVCAPGGLVAVRESDLRMWSYYPELDGVKRFHHILIETNRIATGQLDPGPRLVAWAMKAGARREQITPSWSTWSYSEPAERELWAGVIAKRCRDGSVRPQAIKAGLATAEEMDKIADDWEEWARTEDATFGSMLGEILVRK